MNKILLILVLVSLQFTSLGQCPNASGYSISLANSGVYNTYDCNDAIDINSIKTHEKFYAMSIGNFSTNGGVNLVTWFVDGIAIGNTGALPAGFEKGIAISTPGNHVVKVKIQFTDGCFVEPQTNVTIVARDCPFVSLSLNNYSPCLFPESELSATLTSSDPTSTIGNVEWNVNNSIYYSSGSNFQFDIPTADLFEGTGEVEVILSNGSTCIAGINGPGCLYSLGDYYFSDPYFELVGDLVTYGNLQVVFKGDNIHLDIAYGNHTYNLFVDGVSVGTYSNLTYNSVFYTINNISSGPHQIVLKGEFSRGNCLDSDTLNINVVDELEPIEDCIGCNTFKPFPGEKYWLSAWVKENQSSQVKNYLSSSINLQFIGSSGVIGNSVFVPSGEIIDGWQRVVGVFTIPSATTDLEIKLVNSSSTVANYFDDIRIHPFKASMKSYVYDPLTLILTAELDDNNFATFYEYDKEGQLIRIKKETSRGIMTIQESRSNNPKVD